jgi:hypothetical protein
MATMKRVCVICAICGFLLAFIAGAGYFQVIWKIYRAAGMDYGSPPYSVGVFESNFLYWFAGCGLLITVGLTVGLGLLLPRGFRLPNWSLAMIPLAVVLALAARFWVFQQSAATDEENVYRFTAELLSHGRLALHTDLPPELLGPRWGWMRHDQDWAGIYPYGWPLLLALGYLLRVPWLMNPLLAGVVLWLAAAVARRAYGPGAAVLTLVFLGASPFLIFTAATDVAAPLAAAGVLAAVLHALTYLEEQHAPQLARFGLAGGLALFTRRLWAGALLAPWWALLLWRERRPKRTIVWLAPLLGTVLLLLALNSRLTGDAFQTPYHFSLRAWGVRLDGATLGFDADYRPVAGIGVHTVTLGLLNSFVSLLRLNYWLLGWPLSLLLVCCAPWTRPTKLLLGGVLLLFMAATTSYSPGFTVSGPPLFVEAGCLLAILAAAGLDRLARWYAGTAAAQFAPHAVTALGFSIVVVNLALFTPFQVRSLRAMSRDTSLLSRTVRERVSPPAVVFVENVQAANAPTSYIYFPPMNASLDDNVLLLLSHQTVEDRLAWKKYFPHRHAFRYHTGTDGKPVLEILE